MKFFTTSLFCFLAAIASAQYTTPGNGENLTLDELVSTSEGTVTDSDGEYFINAGLTIAESDTLTVSQSLVRIAPDTVVTVAGAFFSSDGAIFTSLVEDQHFGGFRFEETAHINIDMTTITYGGGLKVITPDFRITNSLLTNHVAGTTTSSVLTFSNGKPVVDGCEFFDNELSAISSPANGQVAPIIENCTLENNVTSNSNTPQINLGPTGSDTAFIRMNIITGSEELGEVGGISVATLVGGDINAVIEQNVISNNRYGINAYGGDINTLINDNEIVDNDNEDDPFFGGSGISITGFGDNNYHVITNNLITGNLWGITLITDAHANLGDMSENGIGPGNNRFDNNGNGGQTYALFNNTGNTQLAQGNCWIISNPDATLAEAEDVISHVEDDAELGEVIFDPLGNCQPDGLAETSWNEAANLYPNPAHDRFYIELKKDANRISVYDVTGRKIESIEVRRGQNLIEFPAKGYAPGIYTVEIIGEGHRSTGKLVVNR